MVRQATEEDREAVVRTVTAAFVGDPAWRFLFGDEYELQAPRFAAALFDGRVARRTVWVSDGVAAVAMWDTWERDQAADARAAGIWDEYGALVGKPASERLELYNQAVRAAASAGPHWYLGVLATHPDSQGQGLATAVLRPAMEAADRAGVACCLETSTIHNRAFYGRRGFTDATDVQIPGGPPTWWLRRAPPDDR